MIETYRLCGIGAKTGWKNSGECLMGKLKAERQDLTQFSADDEIPTLCSVKITCSTGALSCSFPSVLRVNGQLARILK